MMQRQDARVAVVAGGPELAADGDVVQPWPGHDATRHAAGCPCCRPRPALAAALAALFIARGRGDVPFFVRVLVPCPPEQDAALAAALAADPVTASRFRFAGRLQAGPNSSSCSPSARCM
jgi:hypothetical protein